MGWVHNEHLTVAQAGFGNLEDLSSQNLRTYTIKLRWRQTLWSCNPNPIFSHKITYISQGKIIMIIHKLPAWKSVNFNENLKVF